MLNRITVVYQSLPFARRLGAGVVVAGLSLSSASSLLAAAPALAAPKAPAAAPQELLLVSYAVTKAAYDKIIPAFEADWKKKTGQTVRIKTSFGGSGSQTRAVLDGLEADVVGLAMEADVLKLEAKGLIQPGWQKELPNNSIATNSTIAFFLRPGNPKKISTWEDLNNKGVDVVTANPKTSGGARWSFLGLWGNQIQTGKSEAQARAYVGSVLRNVDVLPKDAREATDTFVKRHKGDVLLNWETEAILARKNREWTVPYKLPSPNVLTEMPIAVVDRNVDKHGTRKVAEAFSKFLFTPTAQKLFVDNGFRPVTPAGKAYARGKFQEVQFFRISDFGGWAAFDKKFFGKGGVWDQIFSKSR